MTPLKNSLVVRFCIKVFGFLPYAMEKIPKYAKKCNQQCILYRSALGWHPSKLSRQETRL